jgi:S-formylglutathione hydrolase FrmB
MALRSLHRLLLGAFTASISAIGCASADGTVDPPTSNAPAPPVAEATPPAATETQPPAEAPSEAPGTSTPPTTPFDPTTQITSGEDITVDHVTTVSPRTFDVFLSTPAISPKALMAHGNAVRVTVPPDYATSGKHYPVLYFLHGASCNYTTASEIIGIEDRAILDDVIVVMPEAGKYGFYTDWLDESIAQKWETYHLTQLVPFIDRNLRTIGAKEGRGIIGFSMGGLGAMRYAVDHPELFAAATTLSGIVDLNHGAVQTGVVAMLAMANLNVAGPFGALGVSPVWGQKNPASHVTQLATVNTAIYVGKGTDIAEATTASASAVLHHNLEDNNIAHYYENYGVPGETPDGTCDGGHNNDCAKYSTTKALPRLRAALANPQ